MLSRVTWPKYDVGLVVDALATNAHRFERVCVQVTVSPGSFSVTLRLIELLRLRTRLPVDSSVLPPSVSAAEELLEAGLDHLGFGLDAATRDVFEATKGSGWERYMGLMEAIGARYPGRFAVHLIAGLGETEQQMVSAMQHWHDLGGCIALFSFWPIPGTRMEGKETLDLRAYRRLQLARYLIASDAGREVDFEFDGQGTIVGYVGSIPRGELQLGHAFETSGCPGCNRPFYNERPSGPIYNYPRSLTSSEAAEALRMSGIPELAILGASLADG